MRALFFRHQYSGVGSGVLFCSLSEVMHASLSSTDLPAQLACVSAAHDSLTAMIR